MTQTVSEVLTAATDSVTLINDIKTNGNKSKYAGSITDKNGNSIESEWTQAEINEVMQKNVDHLETILEYTDPDVKGSSDSKTSYTAAITTGKTYITDNS